MTKTKKILSAFLAVIMVLSIFSVIPLTAFAGTSVDLACKTNDDRKISFSVFACRKGDFNRVLYPVLLVLYFLRQIGYNSICGVLYRTLITGVFKMPSTLKSELESARKFKNINDPIDTYIVDYIAMAFSKLFIKLGIIPNAVTILSAIAGVCGGVMLCLNTRLFDMLGVAAVILAAVFDASDGQVARLTKHYSNFGRTLDGFADFLVYLSLYVAICVRVLSVNIPFTKTPFGVYIIPIALIAMLFFGAQARTADYFKNLHMFMATKGRGSELTNTAEIKNQIDGCEKVSFERLRLTIYKTYTGMQESKTPKVQKLLLKIRENGNIITETLSAAFYKKSRKYVMSTNLLTFNLRTIVLFVLLLLPGHIEYLYFPFVIFILEPARLIIIHKYEKLASALTKQNLFFGTEGE